MENGNKVFEDIVEDVTFMIFGHMFNQKEHTVDDVISVASSKEDAFKDAIAYSVYKSIIGDETFSSLKRLRENPSDVKIFMDKDCVIDFMCAYESEKKEFERKVVEENEREIAEEKKKKNEEAKGKFIAVHCVNIKNDIDDEYDEYDEYDDDSLSNTVEPQNISSVTPNIIIPELNPLSTEPFVIPNEEDFGVFRKITGIHENTSSSSSSENNGNVKTITYKKIYNYLNGAIAKKNFKHDIPTLEPTERNTELFMGYYYDPEFIQPYDVSGYVFKIIKN